MIQEAWYYVSNIRSVTGECKQSMLFENVYGELDEVDIQVKGYKCEGSRIGRTFFCLNMKIAPKDGMLRHVRQIKC